MPSFLLFRAQKAKHHFILYYYIDDDVLCYMMMILLYTQYNILLYEYIIKYNVTVYTWGKT